jgi:hypothetical protein
MKLEVMMVGIRMEEKPISAKAQVHGACSWNEVSKVLSWAG